MVEGSTVKTGNDDTLLPAVQGQGVGETKQPVLAQGNTFSHKAQQNVLFQLFQTFTQVQKIIKETNSGKRMGNNSSMKNKSISSSGKSKSC